MAGIYIHIPFCKTRCTYCDFFSMTDFSRQDQLLDAMMREIDLRIDYLNEPVATIYFGGGTPSVLPVSAIDALLRRVYAAFEVAAEAEITLEANPDDLSAEYLVGLRRSGVNRLSIGVQSFEDKQLRSIRRRHSAADAEDAVKLAQSAGFNNLSLDLIFGLPGQSTADWERQIAKALLLDVQHISAYGLTYEEGTALWRQKQAGRVTPADDDTMAAMYDTLCKTSAEAGFERYEISNFAKPGFHSRHNSSYWQQVPYLGIGPAAHSYNGDSRRWNVSSIDRYICALDEKSVFFETETLSEQDKYNDFVMVRLRTVEGIDLAHLETLFGGRFLLHCMNAAQKFIDYGKLSVDGSFLRLTPEGIMISDAIIAALFAVDDE